jgi:hypothetical protein
MSAVTHRFGVEQTTIRPLQLRFRDATLTDLRRRIQATGWPERAIVSDASQLIVRAFHDTSGGITQKEIRL